ncbi:MAG: hypothetical protein SFH39_00500 [Candidatus Magnetobacterium sp. LHC-1]
MIAWVLGALAWHKGGQGNSIYRSIVCPLIVATAQYFILKTFLVFLYVPLMFLMIRGFTYGINAPLHRFIAYIFGKGGEGDCLPVEMTTRAICGLFWAIPAVVFAYINGNYKIFFIYMAILPILTAVFGICKKVEVSEIGTGASVCLSTFI